MVHNAKYLFPFLGLLIALLGVLLLNLIYGSANIPADVLLDLILGKTDIPENWKYIIVEYRLPKALTTLIVGSGLSLCGLLMQTLFRNPLAGPFVLGISSGASLGAALLILGGSLMPSFLNQLLISDTALVLASSLGSFLVMGVVLLISAKMRDVMALLIVGLMFGSITSAVVTIMASFSTAEQLQHYIFWSYGSTGNLSWGQLGILTVVFGLTMLLIISILKALNSLLLGEQYAQTMGVGLKQIRTLILVITGLLAGSITAFAGPIAFVGLAVPHLTRNAFNTSDHRILVPGVCLMGSVLMLVCDTLAQWPFSDYILPINAVTSIIGAPVVIILLTRKNKLRF
ncbi:MAG: hypothetical protein RLZZ241_2484 [Bacteroidota bacterium]|jgi:iron complex transport system permease protein